MKTIISSLKNAAKVLTLSIIFTTTITMNQVMAATEDSYIITAVEMAASSNTNVWNLQYTDSDNSLKIYLTENNGEKEYLVRGKFIEVSYVLNKNGFGARPVKASKAEVPAQIVNNIINRDKLNQQRIIINDQVDNETALNLIAGFLPDLLNENYKHLLK